MNEIKRLFYAFATGALLSVAGLSSSVAQVSEFQTTFWINAYIPDKHPTSDTIITRLSNGTSVVKDPTGRCFTTDSRFRSPDINASARIHHRFNVITRGRNISVVDQVRRVGASHSVDCLTGAILATKSAPETDMSLSVRRVSATRHVINLAASSGNPFFTYVGVNVAPKIDWNVAIEYDVLSRSFKVNYSHGCFPAFEMYARSNGGDITNVVFQDNIMNDCSAFGLIDANIGLNTISGEWGPNDVRAISDAVEGQAIQH